MIRNRFLRFKCYGCGIKHPKYTKDGKLYCEICTSKIATKGLTKKDTTDSRCLFCYKYDFVTISKCIIPHCKMCIWREKGFRKIELIGHYNDNNEWRTDGIYKIINPIRRYGCIDCGSKKIVGILDEWLLCKKSISNFTTKVNVVPFIQRKKSVKRTKRKKSKEWRKKMKIIFKSDKEIYDDIKKYKIDGVEAVDINGYKTYKGTHKKNWYFYKMYEYLRKTPNYEGKIIVDKNGSYIYLWGGYYLSIFPQHPIQRTYSKGFAFLTKMDYVYLYIQFAIYLAKQSKGVKNPTKNTFTYMKEHKKEECKLLKEIIKDLPKK